MVSIHYFTNPLKTGDIYTHAQTVCTRPLLREEGPGNEATVKPRTTTGCVYTLTQKESRTASEKLKARK